MGTIITSLVLLCGNYTSLQCSILSTHCIKGTVPSIRYFNWQKIGLLFCLINWQLTVVDFLEGEIFMNFKNQLLCKNVTLEMCII